MGGAQQLVFEITKRLHQSKNNDVVIFTGLTDKKNSLSALDNNILKLVKRERIKVEIIPYFHDKISFINDFKSFLKICSLLSTYNPSIVHIHSSKAGILGRLACRIKNIKNVIYHVHGWSFARSKGLLKIFYKFLEKALYHFTEKYIFVCKQDMIDFRTDIKIKMKSYIIYPGAKFYSPDEQNRIRLDLRSDMGFSENDHIVGTVGRLDYQKNPEIFVEIAYEYSINDPNAKFLWIGKGSCKDNIEKRINELDLGEKFILPGYIDDVEPYFLVFDTFIITSRYEGLPVTILKALGCGKPSVCFRVNGVNDLSRNFKMVFGVKPLCIETFVEKLVEAKKLLNNNKKIVEIESNYVRQNYNFEKMYDNILGVYNV